MKNEIFTVESNNQIQADIFQIILSGNTNEITSCGQFVNILLDGCYLRRPISIFDMDDRSITLLYKVIGRGTKKLSEMPSGSRLDVLVGLGNGFDISVAGKNPLVIGGGIGIAPLYLTARKLVEEGSSVTAILGFRTKEEKYCHGLFEELGCNVIVTTEDGSYGHKGFVTDAIGLGDGTEDYSYVYACGPEPMLRAVFSATCGPAQFSFEERMGCGFGACMGCSCKTVTGYKRICKDGPVLYREEIIWDR